MQQTIDISTATFQMQQLFRVYNEQCNGREIGYTASEIRDGNLQSWIVMNGIELSYMNYQGKDQPIFMCNRYTDEDGDGTYYFKTFQDCKEVWEMTKEQLEEYNRQNEYYPPDPEERYWAAAATCSERFSYDDFE